MEAQWIGSDGRLLHVPNCFDSSDRFALFDSFQSFLPKHHFVGHFLEDRIFRIFVVVAIASLCSTSKSSEAGFRRNIPLITQSQSYRITTEKTENCQLLSTNLQAAKFICFQIN